MKEYKVIVDGFEVGIVELTREEVKALLSDGAIQVTEVTGA